MLYNGPSASKPLLLPLERPHPFCLTARIDRVIGNPAYDRHNLNRAGGECITQKSTMSILLIKILHQQRPCNDGLPPPVGHPHPFRSMARIDRVIGNPTYGRRHLNRAGGVGCITQQSTMVICVEKILHQKCPAWTAANGNGRHNNQPKMGGCGGEEDGEEGRNLRARRERGGNIAHH